MTDSYFLKCLGYPELRTADGRPVRIRVKKHMALLTFLAVEQDFPHERGRLVELLWPRATEDRGRHSCATALSQLRTIFGRDAFLSTRTTVRFKPVGLAMDLDYLTDEGLFGRDGEAQVEPDGFLRGFDVDDAPEFSLWRERQYAERLPATHRGLLRLIDHGRRRGSHDEIMKWAERLLSLDHLAEEGIRAKMEAMALVGDRLSAIRIFDEWKQQLGVELSAEPSLTVDGMASQLRKRGWDSNGASTRPAVPTEQWRDRPFVGRRAEYRRLYETWEAVHQHHPRHFLISGDSGVGKTTLAQRLVTAAGLEGASVSRVQCYPLEQRIPYGAIGGLITGLLGRPGVAATAPEALAEIARIVPAIHGHFAVLPAPRQSEGEAARLLFTEGVVDLFQATVYEKPVLLVVDDIQYADEASLAVLHLVMRKINAGRFLIVLTMRHGDMGATNAYRLLESSYRLPIDALPLEPLAPNESRELLVALLTRGRAPTAPERNALLRTAKGLPMAIELLADDWTANGRDCLALSTFAMTSAIQDIQTAADDPYSVVAQKLLTSLKPASRQMLVLAAVHGSGIQDLEAYRLVGLSPDQAMEALTDLIAHRVLRDVGGQIEFINEIVRAHTYRHTPAATRKRLHRTIVEWARLTGHTLPDLLTAWHLMRAGAPAEASPFIISGSAEVLSRGAPDEAILALDTAIPELPPTQQPEATLLLVEALHELGRWQEGLSRLEQLPSDMNDPRAFVFAVEAKWRLGTLHHDNPRQMTEQLVELSLPPSKTGAKAAQLAALIAGSFQDHDALGSLRKQFSPNDGATFPGYMTAQAIAAYYCRDLASAETDATEALKRLNASGAGGTQVFLLEIGLGAIASSQGQYEHSAYRHRRAAEIAHNIDNDRMRMQATAGHALALLRLGRLDDVIDVANSTPLDPSLYRNPTIGVSVATMAYAQCCALALLDRKAEALRRVSSEGLTELDMCAQSWMRQVWGFYKADILWLTGNRRRAAEEASSTILSAPSPLSKGVIGSLCRWVALTGRPRESSANDTGLYSRQLDQLGELDRIDQLEVLLSAAYRGRNDLRDGAKTIDAVRRVAADLPPAAVDFVQRFFATKGEPTT